MATMDFQKIIEDSRGKDRETRWEGTCLQYLEKLADDLNLNLYLYEGQQKQGEIQYVITNRDWQQVKSLLVSYLSTFGIPWVMVLDGDFKGRRELYLKQAYDGIELDQEYRERTMENIYYLWDRPIHLETMVDKKSVVYTLDEAGDTMAPKG